jgi:sulfite exporter TauE/SafE
MEEMKSPAFQEKMKQGPVAILTVMPNGPGSMGKPLALWFLYCVVVGFFAAYVASRSLARGAAYMPVFQLVTVTAFIGYSLALWQMSIWYQRAWSTTVRATIDGAIYALLTAGAFAWLWPR